MLFCGIFQKYSSLPAKYRLHLKVLHLYYKNYVLLSLYLLMSFWGFPELFIFNGKKEATSIGFKSLEFFFMLLLPKKTIKIGMKLLVCNRITLIIRTMYLYWQTAKKLGNFLSKYFSLYRVALRSFIFSCFRKVCVLNLRENFFFLNLKPSFKNRLELVWSTNYLEQWVF